MSFSVFGQQYPAAPATISWIAGPAKANLGDSAEIAVPDGYRFAGAEDARALLQRMRNPVPRGLAGILTPVSGAWMVIFEVTDTGYVKDNGKETIKPAAILQKIRERTERQNQETMRRGGAPISLVEWEQEPTHDRNEHSVEWAIRAQSGAFTVVNHVVRLLGRHGSVDAIAVQSAQFYKDVPLRDLMKGVSFKPGQMYADYRPGDKISKRALGDLIAADESVVAKDSRLPLILGSCGAFVGCGGVIGAWAWRKRVRRRRASMTRFTSDYESPEMLPAPAHSNGSKKVVLSAAAPGTGNRLNGHRNGHHSSGRRKVFDYQRFYADLMLQVSDRAYAMGSPLPKRNGSDSVDLQNGAAASQKMAHQGSLLTNQDLIACQKNLIEEQQRFIQEQTRLIEEKAKLIQEKSQLLEKQTELFGNGVY